MLRAVWHAAVVALSATGGVLAGFVILVRVLRREIRRDPRPHLRLVTAGTFDDELERRIAAARIRRTRRSG